MRFNGTSVIIFCVVGFVGCSQSSIENSKAVSTGQDRSSNGDSKSTPPADEKSLPRDAGKQPAASQNDGRKKDKDAAEVINVEVLHPLNFKVGQRGPIIPNPQGSHYYFEVERILSDNELIVREYIADGGRTELRFIVQMPTKGLADDARIKLEGVMEVVDTKRIGSQTFFVLRHAPKS